MTDAASTGGHRVTVGWRNWATVGGILLVAAPGTGACRADAPCTLIGCEDGITAQIGSGVFAGAEGEVTVETCVEGACRRDRVDPDASRHGTVVGVPASGLAPGDDVTVTVTVTDGGGVELAEVNERITMQRSQPNGPGCGPVCVVGAVTVGAAPGEPSP